MVEARTTPVCPLSNTLLGCLQPPGDGAINPKKKREPTSPPLLNRTTAIRYLWPECVIRAMMSRRLSATCAPKKASRSAALHLPSVALTALAHLSMPSALG